METQTKYNVQLAIVKFDGTDHLNEAVMPESLKGVSFAEYYLVNLSEAVYLCELKPSYYLENLYNRFGLTKDFDDYSEEEQDYISSLEFADCESDFFIHCDTNFDFIHKYGLMEFDSKEEAEEYRDAIKNTLWGNPIE